MPPDRLCDKCFTGIALFETHYNPNIVPVVRMRQLKHREVK